MSSSGSKSDRRRHGHQGRGKFSSSTTLRTPLGSSFPRACASAWSSPTPSSTPQVGTPHRDRSQIVGIANVLRRGLPSGSSFPHVFTFKSSAQTLGTRQKGQRTQFFPVFYYGIRSPVKFPFCKRIKIQEAFQEETFKMDFVDAEKFSTTFPKK